MHLRRRALLRFVVAGVALAACSPTDSGVSAVRSETIAAQSPDPPSAAELPEGVTAADVIDFGGRRTPQSWDDAIAAYVTDIESFWNQEYQRVYGSPWTALDGGVHASFVEREGPLPDGCGEISPTDLEGNAFYCSLGDFIVYDDDTLVPLLVDQFGIATLGVVLAHEYGHAAQQRALNLEQPIILAEQQADCFAGAWVAHVARGESDTISFSNSDILDGLVAMIAVRDPVFGVEAGSDSHGTGFDRVGAFQDGFRSGTDRCVPFFQEDRQDVLVDVPFDVADLQTQGNLPYEDIVASIGGDLDRFWRTTFAAGNLTFEAPAIVASTPGQAATCDGGSIPSGEGPPVAFCVDSGAIVIDEQAARQLYTTSLPSLTGEPVVLGDMSVGYLLATAFSDAAQRALGTVATADALAVGSDCLTGAWVADIIPPFDEERDLRLSAGDLDEAVLTALLTADEANGGAGRGPAFDKIDAFRSGVLGGIAACDL